MTEIDKRGFNMARNNDNGYVKICLFCESASPLKSGNSLLCKYKGVVSEDNVCRRFSYDPLKREPKSPPKLPAINKDDLL